MLHVNDKTRQQIFIMKNDWLTVLDKERLKGELRKQEPMSRHTTWKTGGAAEVFYEPADLEDLSTFIRMLPDTVPIIWVGKGSNLLVRDGGIEGVVISVDGVIDQCWLINAAEIELGAGLACAKAARFAAANGFTGIEFLAGIPGTIGGALAMNAGAWGWETWRYVSRIETIDRHGQIKLYDSSQFKIGYRSVSLPECEWFVAARMQLEKEEKNIVRKRIRNILNKRAETQPLGQLSCGSVFRNPDNDYAARLIEDCGLKAYCIGGACVSDKHANFIINTGTASATDIEQLIEHVRFHVERDHGVNLIPEVRIVGLPTSGEAN